ncbi:MAG: hypothetical protein KJZ77_08580 [Anaerolineales bacterium]|nr:hypothetical protein [Anaerolineales bacterium]
MSGGYNKRARQLQTARWWLVIILAAGLSACEIAPSQTPAKPTPCMPDAGNANPYNSSPHQWAREIYQHSGIVMNPGIPVTGDQEQQVLRSRYAALRFLTDETTRWSAVKTIRLNTSSEVHIIITYIHPELIQAAYLNEILEKKHMIQDIDAQIIQAISKVSRREELLFMMTVVSHHRDAFNIQKSKLVMPVSKLMLKNSGSIPVAPSHYDSNLDQPIDISLGPIFGFVAYPIGIQSNNRCLWVLDTTFNNKIVITTDALMVDGLKSDSHAWAIQYEPIIESGIPIGSPDFSTLNYDLRQPPSATIPPSNINDVNFWMDYSRFVWKQILFGN